MKKGAKKGARREEKARGAKKRREARRKGAKRRRKARGAKIRLSPTVLLVDSMFLWSGHRNLSPELVVYLNSCGVNLYFIGNLLHTLNTYSMIVVPVRYTLMASKIRKILVKFLGPIFIIITRLIIIPLYTLPEKTVSSYVKGLTTFTCAQLMLLTVIFIFLYKNISNITCTKT